MTRRLARAAAALALLALLGVATTFCMSAGPPSTATHLQRDQPDAMVSTLDVTESTLSAATSGCGLCQQTGLCDHAFKGTRGQFCLTLVSGAPCCCPQNAQCVVSNAYNCRCRRVTTNQLPHSSSTTTTTTTSGIKSMELFPLFAMLLCVLCCVCAARNRNPPETAYPYQPQTVYPTQQYGATQNTQPAYYPSAPPASPYAAQSYDPYAPYAAPMRAEPPRDNSSGNAFAAGAVGAVAGLATGMLAGPMFGGGHSRPETTTTTTTTSYFGGGSGGYEFSGDTGGGGDDGGDFGGDS